jgi:hypothetical protein
MAVSFSDLQLRCRNREAWPSARSWAAYIPVPGYPGVSPERRDEGGYYAEHCERLREREHELRDHLPYAPPQTARSGKNGSILRQVHEER